MEKQFNIKDTVYAYVRNKGYIVKGEIYRKDTVETYRNAINIYYYISGEVIAGDEEIKGMRVQLEEIHESLVFEDEGLVKAYGILRG